MLRSIVSMRWWLALLFACVAATTALIVAQVFESSTESAIRERAADLTAGAAVAAANRLGGLEAGPELDGTVEDLAVRRRLIVFVFDRDGRRISPYRVQGVTFRSLPNGPELRDTALRGRRAVETIEDGRRVTVALPIRRAPRAVLVAVASRPDLEAALGIVHDRIIGAALWATGAGALLGLVIAALIARRLGRIARAAARFQVGEASEPLGAGFPDELGRLAVTIDAMRDRLTGSFATLASERDRLSRLLEQLQEGVVAVDPSLRVEFANANAARLLRAPVEPGCALPDPWDNPSIADLARRLFLPGAAAATTHVEVDARTVLTVTGLPPASADASAVLVITDVTERERRERVEREFVTNAAHELRTPLAAIASAVEVLNAGAKDDDASRDRFLAVITRQTGRLTALVHALLTLARAQTDVEDVRFDAVPLAPLLREIATDHEPGAIVVTAPDDLAAVSHRPLLRQAVDNLVANALRHGEGSDVALRARRLPGGRVSIEISDRGPGMTAEEAERAFDRFYRGSPSDGNGYGLGLAIVRQVVAVLEGTVEITSRPGAGTTASIVLPATPARTR